MIKQQMEQPAKEARTVASTVEMPGMTRPPEAVGKPHKKPSGSQARITHWGSPLSWRVKGYNNAPQKDQTAWEG